MVFCCSYGVRVGRTDLNSADPHLITSRTDHILRPRFRYIHTGQSQSKNFGHHFYPKNYACFWVQNRRSKGKKLDGLYRKRKIQYMLMRPSSLQIFGLPTFDLTPTSKAAMLTLSQSIYFIHFNIK